MEEFKGKLGKYKIIKTDDNTNTIWSEYFDENCHNLSGAKEETLYNYIEGCELLQFSKKFDPVNIFDVGFGPGLGLLYLSKNLNTENIINYYSIEIDPELIKWALINNFNNVNHIENETNSLNYIRFSLKNINIFIFIGDGRETIPKAIKQSLILPIHAIFQDPFSPKKNPTLWTVEWFLLLKSISHEEVLLSTYSSSVSIRKSLIEAGFKIENRKGFGQKRTMTRARLKGTTDPQTQIDLDRSPTLSLHDSKISL